MKRLLVVLPLLLLLGCPTGGTIERCEGEAKAVEKDGQIRVQTLMAPVDVTSGGQLTGGPLEGPRSMKALLLLDYSGSMYAGYAEPKVPGCERCQATEKRRGKQPYYYDDPAFRSLIAEWLDAAGPAGVDIEAQVLLFNTKLFEFDANGATREVSSSSKLGFPLKLSEMAPSEIAAELAKIPPDPFRATGRNANETHLKEAMLTAADLLGEDGLLWIITDNISDQSGAGVSKADAARNLAFYDALNRDARLQTVMAYPLHDEKKCTFMCGTSLFVYGIHVSTRTRNGAAEVNRLAGGHLGDGDASADGVLWNQQLKGAAAQHAGSGKRPEIVGVPLRLKPMDLDVVTVKFEEDEKGRARPIRCRRTQEFGAKVPCVATVVVKNNLRHQILESATVVFENDVMIPHKAREKTRLEWAGAVCAGSVETYNEKLQKQSEFPIRDLPPGQEEKIRVLMVLPAVTVAPAGVGQTFDTAFTDTVYLSGNLTARVEDVKTRLDVDKEQRREVYGADALPAIFKARSQTEVRVQFGASVPVQNDGRLAALILIGGLLLLLLLLILIILRFQRVAVTVLVDGVEADRMSLPRVSSRKLEVNGVRLGKVKRGWSRAVSFVGARGMKTKKQGGAWIVEPPGGMEKRVELKMGWRKRGGGGGKKGAPGGF